MSIQSQDNLYTLLGYSLKRDYLGDGFNWRNVETFNFTIAAIDLANVSTDAHGNNTLSNYIRAYLASKINADKSNITIKSIDIDGSIDDNHIQKATYKVTAEVRTKIDEATLLAQHPELDDTGVNTAEDHKFHGVKTVFSGYTDQIDSISESFDFSDKEDGGKDFSHTVDLTIRQGSWTSTPKQIAQSIANALFSQDVNNTYFGHNSFSGALGTHGNSASNKHYFSESYDQFANKFSFTKKMEILPIDATTYTANKKYSIDVKQEGGITIAETVELKSRNGTFSDITNAISSWIDDATAYSRCNAIITNYSNTIDGQGVNTSSTAPTLATKPTSKTVSYDKQGLTATISLSFSTEVQAASNSSFLETIDLNRDHRGVTSATYNVTLTSHRHKKLDADQDYWVDGYCTNGNGGETDRSTCEGNNGDWTFPKTPPDVLKSYGDAAVTKICEVANYSNQALTTKGVFWNTLSWYWPAGIDQGLPNQWSTSSDRGWLRESIGCQYYPVSSSISSANMGKSFTLNKVFSNDVVYSISDMSFGAMKSDYFKHCPDCFKKIEVKYQDTWPKKTVTEHAIIDRGGVGEITWMPFVDGNGNTIYAQSETTTAVTNNKSNTSVLSDSYMTQAGKRNVTINASLKRPLTNNLTNPKLPTNQLKALAYEAKNTLLQVFGNSKIKNSYQFVAYISNINYSYNSENQITMTAELTYTYKAPPPLGVHP